MSPTRQCTDHGMAVHEHVAWKLLGGELLACQIQMMKIEKFFYRKSSDI